MTRKTKRVLKGALAGLAGGLAGTVAMTQFQKLWSKAAGCSQGSGKEDPATVKAALSLLPVSRDRKDIAGDLVHYSFGTLNGAMYGAAAEVAPRARAGAGSLFGTALFLVADEAVVPLMGWSKPPREYPWSSHLYGLASHLVYGVATEGVRRAVRAAM